MSVQEILAARLGAVLSTIVIIVPGPGTGIDQPGPTTGAPTTVTVPAVPHVSPVPSDELSRSSTSSVDTLAPASAATVIQGRGGTVQVTDAASLTAALAAAKPGQSIEMADGTYSGKFVINTAGQQGNPITLKGSRKAVLDGGDTGSGYTVHLNGADYWQLVGFSVTGGQKGIMADKTNHSVLSGLDVGNTGQEAVHLLNFSTSNVVQNSVIHDTGKADPQFGEGLYFGTAKSNWAKKSGGKPDKSDKNKAIANTFRNTTAENIDVKEETSGGVISGNSFDGSAVSGANFADSVLDLKGVGYQVLNNVTSGASAKLKDGFQTHVITEPATSGCNNTFRNNTFNVQLPGKSVALDAKCGTSP